MDFIGRLFVVFGILITMIYVFISGINFFFTRYENDDKKRKGTILFLLNIPLGIIIQEYLWIIIIPLTAVLGIEVFFISKALLKK